MEHDADDEIGVLARSFNDMALSLTTHEAALQRKVVETTTLYDIGQEIIAQVALAPTLELIVARAHALLQADASLLALRQQDSDMFVIQAHSGTISEARYQHTLPSWSGPGRTHCGDGHADYGG